MAQIEIDRDRCCETAVWVEAAVDTYADIIRDGCRFKFSHETLTRDRNGTGTIWLLFEHVRAASAAHESGAARNEVDSARN